MKHLLSLFLLTLLLCSCEDVVELDSRFEDPQLVVDAWLNNRSEPQTVILTESQDFYANRLPMPVTDAEVVVCPDNDPAACIVFAHAGEGRYVWNPEPGDSLGVVGTDYSLGIQRGDDQYLAQTTMERSAIIDSLSFQFEEEQLGLDEGFYAQIYARDQVGVGDAYWIRTTFNDTLLALPDEINIAYDATFDPGTGTDGVAFIFPIRFSINYQDEDGGFVPLADQDTVAVEIIGLSEEAFLFLSIATEQIQNGEAGIFALPVANSPGNVFNVTTEERVLGVFNIGEVVRIKRVFED